MALYKVTFESDETGNVLQLDELLKKHDFCNIVAKQFRSTDPKRPTPATINYLPWMIPIVGSGALDTVGSWEVSLDHLLQDIFDTVEGFGDSPLESEALGTIASRFVRSLVRGRRRTEAQTVDKTQTRVDVTESAARLVVVTALLTRYCHVVRAMGPAALDRSSDEIIESLAITTAAEDPYKIVQTIREPLKQHLDQLKPALRGDKKYQALGIIVEQLRNELDRDRPLVSMNWVRLLTEACWLKLVDQPNTYYGWSELMLQLFLVSNVQGTNVRRRDDTATIRLFPRRARHADFTKVGELVREAFIGPTTGSWRMNNPSPIHDAVAQVLIRQAAQTGRAVNQHLPRAVAISTAFDLELEMSLWRAGAAYQVAIPLHAHNDDGLAELVWMVGTVDPDGATASTDPIEAIRNPRSWVPLSARSSGELRKQMPLILRVTGCPLISIKGECSDRTLALVRPRPSDSARSENVAPSYGFRPDVQLFVNHAVAVDEYLAIRLAESEVQRAYESLQPNTHQRQEVADVGQAFAGSPKNPTYFAFFGVPFADAAVRQRLMSLLTVRWIQRAKVVSDQADRPLTPVDWDADPNAAPTAPAMAAAAEPYPDEPPDGLLAGPGSLNGIAINTRLDLEEASLLSSLGLSVVHGDCSEMVPHMLDYASHVCDDSGSFNPMHSSICTVRNPQ